VERLRKLAICRTNQDEHERHSGRHVEHAHAEAAELMLPLAPLKTTTDAVPKLSTDFSL